jgi:hypothetical protein
MRVLGKCFAVTAVAVFLFSVAAEAKGGGKGGGPKSGPVNVRPYTKKDGTHVDRHHRSAPDGSKTNNWTSKGNVNPYTGKTGTK